jgi:hypothetical protein
MGMLVLVAAAAVALLLYRRYTEKVDRRPSIPARYASTPPVVDGVIGPNEYGGEPVSISWSGGGLTAFQKHLLDPTQSATPGDLKTAPVREDPTESKTPADLSLEAYAAYTDTALFLAFKVHDQFVDAQEEDRNHPEWNDGVEVFIDADHVADDFTTGGGVRGNSEGFQIIANAAGHQFTASTDFTSADWKAAAKRTNDGYIVEMEIPLALIDTKDGPGVVPPGPGSLLHLGLAVTDNDQEVSRQTSYAYLRTPKQTEAPWLGREGAWNFGIKLGSKWFPW